MDSFARFELFLAELLANPHPDPGVVNQLQLKLERARPRFVDLLANPPKNQKERDAVQKGTFTYVADGASYPLSPQLQQQVLLLSDSINISEDLAASYVSFAINSRDPTTRSTASKAEAGLLVLLNERASLLRCLHSIWRGALSAEPGLVSSGVVQLLERETEQLTRARPAVGSSKQGWVGRVISLIDEQSQTVAQLRTQLSQPIPSSSLVLGGAGQQQQAKLSDEAIQLRAERLEGERHSLGQLLFFLAAARQLSQDDLIALTKQLAATQPTDGAAVYTLTALLAALDASGEQAAQALYPLFNDASFVSSMNALLSLASPAWQSAQLKATVQLQWTVFLDAAARWVQGFEKDGGEYVDNLTWAAIHSDVFAFLGKAVLGFKRGEAELDEVWGDVGASIAPLGAEAGVDESFEEYVSEQVEILVVEVIANRTAIFRKLRNKEEDTVSTSHRGGSLRASRGHDDSKPVEVRHDLEAFFLLIATIYRDSPDSALKFWADPEQALAAPAKDGQQQQLAVANTASAAITSRLGAFLRWGSECRPPGMIRAYYEMIAALASGPKCATHAFEFLSHANGGSEPAGPSANFSWASLFGALEFYHQNLPDRHPDAGAHAEGALGEMPPEEVPLLRSFVRLLRQVVAYSDVARATLYDNQRHRPIQTLFALLGRPIPIELKASLLQAIAAFARPGGTFGIDVARRTWAVLEQSQILPTLAPSEGRDPRGGAGLSLRGAGGPLTIEGGIFTELEEVEAPNAVYPESTAFVELLNTLIHTPSSLEPVRRGLELEQQHTIPENLGAPHRLPGIEPYTRFVVDDVLLKTTQRAFEDPREQWRVTEVCLAFVEKCLASYELGPFLAWAAAGGAKASAAQQNAATGAPTPLQTILVHPGFDILTRLLSGSALLESVLTIVIAGYDAIANNLAKTPLFTHCMLRCLRILKLTFDLQQPFIATVLPAMAESSAQHHLTQDKLTRLQTVTPVDQALLYHSEAVVQIALLVSCGEEDEIALLAVQILAILADSPLFEVTQKFEGLSRTKLNRLVGLLQASPETLRIVDGFVVRLDEDVPESDLDLGEWDGADSTSTSQGGGSIRQAIRRAILDLLLQTTSPDRAGPNIAHLLLGFNVTGKANELEIEDPDLDTTQHTALHVVLHLLAQAVSDDAQEAQASILARHPTMAAQCYQLVRQLCLHPYTSQAISRYLRSREQFFLRQSGALPFAVPPAAAGGLGSLTYNDTGVVVGTSSNAVCAVLESEAWLLESTALELSVLSTANETRRMTELVGSLFATPVREPNAEDDMLYIEAAGGGAASGAVRMLDVFHSLDFSWHDAIEPKPVQLSFFAELRFESCLSADSSGAEVYDFSLLLALISAAKRELQQRGVLNTQAQQDQAKAETRAIVETLVVENHRRQIQHARLHALRAWRTLVDITLTKAFHLLPQESTHSLLLDFMSALLPPLAAQETDAAISELLSGAAVLLMTKLRDEGALTFALAGSVQDSNDRAGAADPVAPERLETVLRGVLNAIIQPGVQPTVRGNLYAVLLNYLQYSSKLAQLTPAGRAVDAQTETGSVVGADDTFSLDGLSTVGGGRAGRPRRHALEMSNLAILQSALERLVPIVARDASVGHEVWRTVAFTLLDALTSHFAPHPPSHAKLLSILTKQGYLQAFVASLSTAEQDLTECLRDEPESLNALYVYEAMMSWLVRLGGSTREGAERLLASGAVEQLARSNFIGARPAAAEEGTLGGMDLDGFLPPAQERHHQLLLPALQLVTGTLTAFGAETPAATSAALAFVGGQRETLLLALRDGQQKLTLAAIREAHLIATLLGVVLPAVNEEEMTTLSSFGGLHAAVQQLAAKLTGPGWQKELAPANDQEAEEANTLVLSLRETTTLFAQKAAVLVESLQAAVLSYQVVFTRRQPAKFKSTWAPTLAKHATESVTLGQGLAFVGHTVARLENRLEEARMTRERLDAFEETDADELEEALSFPEEEGVPLAERRARLHAELVALKGKTTQAVDSSLHLLELSLLLLFRHLSHFLRPQSADGANGGRPDFGVGRGLADALRNRGQQQSALGGAADAEQLRSSAAPEVRAVVARLEKVADSIAAGKRGHGWVGREAYLGTVGRRVVELVSVEDGGDE